jgi:hypothetical protein
MSSRFTRKISMTIGQASDRLITQGVPAHWLSSAVQDCVEAITIYTPEHPTRDDLCDAIRAKISTWAETLRTEGEGSMRSIADQADDDSVYLQDMINEIESAE